MDLELDPGWRTEEPHQEHQEDLQEEVPHHGIPFERPALPAKVQNQVPVLRDRLLVDYTAVVVSQIVRSPHCHPPVPAQRRRLREEQEEDYHQNLAR